MPVWVAIFINLMVAKTTLEVQTAIALKLAMVMHALVGICISPIQAKTMLVLAIAPALILVIERSSY
jgi:hypothetical protein